MRINCRNEYTVYTNKNNQYFKSSKIDLDILTRRKLDNDMFMGYLFQNIHHKRIYNSSKHHKRIYIYIPNVNKTNTFKFYEMF